APRTRCLAPRRCPGGRDVRWEARDRRSVGRRGPRQWRPAVWPRPRLLAAVELAHHPLGDVHPGADVVGLLHDQVEFLGLGNRADHAIELLDDLLQGLVATQVELFLKIALTPLQVALLLDK